MWRQTVFIDSTRGNRHKVEIRKIQIDIMKTFLTLRVASYWNRLPINAAKSLSSERFKTSQVPEQRDLIVPVLSRGLE